MTAHVTTGVVAWSETDASGRYHHTAPHCWAENTEHALYRSIVPDIDVGPFPRLMTSASFEKPLFAGDEYTVELDVDHIGNSSITYTWVVTGPEGVCVRGNHTAVHVDETGRPSPVPEKLREGLTGSDT